MEFMVNKQTGERIPTAGITLYADLPVGSWVKNDMGTIPAGFLKQGDTISPTEYPELYAKYGSTVPYMADTSELSNYENITISTSSSSPTVMTYDGYLTVYATGGPRGIYINGVKVANASPTGDLDATTTVAVKKGDQVYFTNWHTNCCRGAFYKKSLIVKAKNMGVPSDIINSVWDAIFPTAPTTPTAVYSNLNSSSNIDYTYTVTERGFYLVRLHCYSEGQSHSWQLYLNGVLIGSESSYQPTSGVGATMTLPCNVGDTIRMVVSCGGSGTYDKRHAAIYKL